MDLTVTDHLLTTTRSVRKRLDLDRPVEPEVVLDCIRIAQQAPTGSNSQGWRWIVVTDADKRAKLAELYEQGGGDYIRAARDTVEDGTQTRRVYDSAVFLMDILARVPVHVIPCIEGRLGSTHPAAGGGLYGSILPAVWNFQLAARARGLGTCLTTLHLFKHDETSELLGIPDDYTQVALLPLAYFTGDDFKPAQRPPADTITSWNSWGGSL